MLTPEDLAAIRGTSAAVDVRGPDAPRRAGASLPRLAVPALLVAAVAIAAGTVMVRGADRLEPSAAPAPASAATPATAAARPTNAAAGATPQTGVLFGPSPVTSQAAAASVPPATDRLPTRTGVGAGATAALRPPSVVAPTRGVPGTVFRFTFTGLIPNVAYVAELIPPQGHRPQLFIGTVAADGTLSLPWQSPLDASTGLWQQTLIAGTTVRVVPFEIVR